jgi:hypothetical protein
MFSFSSDIKKKTKIKHNAIKNLLGHLTRKIALGPDSVQT